jgi:hypothetical protein
MSTPKRSKQGTQNCDDPKGTQRKAIDSQGLECLMLIWNIPQTEHALFPVHVLLHLSPQPNLVRNPVKSSRK